MLHDQRLLDLLAAFAPQPWSGRVFRATRRNLDPLSPSTAGGRWMLPDTEPVLYTSMARDGALSELAHHWSLQMPPPSRPALVHTLEVTVSRSLVLAHGDLEKLGVTWPDPQGANLLRSQAVGAAAAFLEFDALRVPSARNTHNNLVIVFTNHHSDDARTALIASEEVDWRSYVS